MRSCPLIFSVSNGGPWKWEEMTSSICVAVMKTTWRGRQSLPNNSQKLDGHLREESFYCGNITWYCLSDRTSHKTRFQMMVSNLSHSVMKNLTEHRMHLEGSKIPQMNLSNHSSQEMSLGENWLFGQENCFHGRKSKIVLFRCTNLGYMTLNAKPLTPDPLLRYHLKTLMYNAPNEQYGRSVASKLNVGCLWDANCTISWNLVIREERFLIKILLLIGFFHQSSKEDVSQFNLFDMFLSLKEYWGEISSFSSFFDVNS